MEVIPPSNLQNSQVPNIQPQNETQPEEEKKESIFDFIRSSIFELFLVFLFLIIILTTFNYFNLIPLSSVFPVLSFLPQQNSLQNELISRNNRVFNGAPQNLSTCNPILDKNILLNYLVSCNNPKTIINSKSNYYDNPISTDGITTTQFIQINVGMEISVLNEKNQNNTFTSGLMLDSKSDKNGMYIFYQGYSNTWMVKFTYSKSQEFESLYNPIPSNPEIGNFSITISPNGTTVNILIPNGLIKTFNLKESVYGNSNTLIPSIIAQPYTKLTLYSLNYYTPD
jgi:hypothetical protein